MSRQARLFLLFAVFGLFACGGRERTAPQQQAVVEDETKPSDGGTVIRRLPADVSTMNPILSTSKYDRWVFFYLFKPLTHFDVNLQVSPGIATSWEITPDGKIYTFHIDPKATFDDGTPVLASDVIWSLKKITDPAVEAVQLAGHFDSVDWPNTKATDAKTAVIAFKKAFAPQLGFFNDLVVLPEHVYSKGDFKTDYNFAAVGCGPYKFVRRVSNKEVLLQRRDDYTGQKGHPQYILFKVINDEATAWQAVMKGDIDETIITSDVWMVERNRPELQKLLEFHRFYPLQYNFIGWNLHDPIFQDKRLRHALAQCLDLRAVIDHLYQGTARAVIGHFTPDMWAYNPEVQPIPYDPAEAQKTLNSLGWLDTNGDGILDKGGKPLKFELLIFSGSSTSALLSQLIQSDLKKIGVQMIITPLDGTTMIKRLLAGNFQAGYLSWDLDPDPDPFQILHSSQIPPTGQNFVYYKSAEADSLMEQGRATIDRKKRIEIYHRLQQVFADDQPYCWTVQVSTKWAVNRRIHGVQESHGWGLFNWYPGELDWWIPARYRKNDAAVAGAATSPATTSTKH